MTEPIPEARQLDLLQRIAEVGERRKRALDEARRLTPELRELCIEAARAGASHGRIRELAQLSSRTTHEWFSQDDVPRRTRRRSVPPT